MLRSTLPLLLIMPLVGCGQGGSPGGSGRGPLAVQT